jgi:hypothetical protein
VKPRPVLNRLLALARRNGELARADPRSEIDLLGAALSQLSNERTAAQDVIDAAASERERLLLEPGSDAKLDELDRTIERQQRIILRCDRVQPLLISQLTDRREAFRAQHFAALIERYRGAVAEYAETLRRVLELKTEISSIRAAAERAGFNEGRLLFDIPYLQCSDPDHFEFATSSQLNSVRLRPAPAAVCIRFNRSVGIYRTHEVAGFTEEDAARYVQAGVAERVTEASP